jgi:hypothetical protein
MIKLEIQRFDTSIYSSLWKWSPKSFGNLQPTDLFYPVLRISPEERLHYMNPYLPEYLNGE